MIIKVTKEYRSLSSFTTDRLAPLTVITGKNGSGKSQFLNLLNLKSKELPGKRVEVEITPKINNIQFEGIIMDKSTTIRYEDWKKIVQEQYNIFIKFTQLQKKLLNLIIKNDLVPIIDQRDRKSLLLETPEYFEIIIDILIELRNDRTIVRKQRPTLETERNVLLSIYKPNTINLIKFIKEICVYTEKEVSEIKATDFFTVPVSETVIDDGYLFSTEIELLFYNYGRRRDINRKNFFYKTVDGEDNNSMSDSDFVSKYPPPWETINEILSNHKVDFYFKGLSKSEFTNDVPINFFIYKKNIDKPISFNTLSSGEKVIIGLVLKLFKSEYYTNELSFPELLILDEPDAHLHPEMSKLLLDVLEETFVKKYGIKVIITTHSPSTIALAPEDSIFELKNGHESSLKKVSKDDALKLLTSFIPTLSIDYKNHKQVFLESPTDVTYFQHIHDRHQQNNHFLNKLYFISNGYGKGNCSEVFKIVREIRKSGNRTSYGIVDWDLANKPEDFVYVHGFEERYSVENFVLDPLYIICLLMDMGNAHNISEGIGVNMTYNQYLLGNESNERLQEFVIYYFEQFQNRFTTHTYEDLVEIKYYNGKTIQVPLWYLKMQGHEIVTKIKIIFPALNKFANEGEIQNKLSFIAAKCYPFVPLSSIHIIEDILNTKD